MKKKLIPLLLASGGFLLACNQQQGADNASAPAQTSATNTAPVASAPIVSKEEAVAIVNGTAISKQTFKTLEDEINQRSGGQTFPKQQLMDELIQRELLVQQAKAKNLSQSPEVLERLKMAEQGLLAQAALQDYLKANPVSDAEVKAEYDKEIAKMSGTEYKARHILTKTEDEAKKIIAELKKGGKFEELAKKHSIDPAASQGGDLGWFTDGQMVEPFSKAVAALENGKFSETPVQTQFGWHVILREDSRAQTPPPFDAVKEQLRPAIQQQKVQTMLEDLRKQAKVEVLISLEEPKKEEASAAPATEVTTTPAATEQKVVTPEAAKPAESEAVKASEANQSTAPAEAKPAETATSAEKSAETKKP